MSSMGLLCGGSAASQQSAAASSPCRGELRLIPAEVRRVGPTPGCGVQAPAARLGPPASSLPPRVSRRSRRPSRPSPEPDPASGDGPLAAAIAHLDLERRRVHPELRSRTSDPGRASSRWSDPPARPGRRACSTSGESARSVGQRREPSLSPAACACSSSTSSGRALGSAPSVRSRSTRRSISEQRLVSGVADPGVARRLVRARSPSGPRPLGPRSPPGGERRCRAARGRSALARC